MGYRYTDEEIERLRKDEVYEKALKAGRATMVHIEPSRDDYEAIEYLVRIYDDAQEILDTMDDFDFNYELAEVAELAVPYNNYKCGMIFAQLGLWFERIQTTLDQDYMDGIRYILYDNALTALYSLARRDY